MGGRAKSGRTKKRCAAAAAGALATLIPLALLACGCADMRPPSSAGAEAVAGRCSDQHFPIYFQRGSADLAPEAQSVIRSASSRVSGCRITGVDVTGMSAPEAGGPVDAVLTQRRADNVARALAAAGLPPPAFDVQVSGARRLPAAGERTPLARRTEVVLHAEPSAAAR